MSESDRDHDLDDLRDEIASLRQAIEAQSDEIRQLRNEIAKQAGLGTQVAGPSPRLPRNVRSPIAGLRRPVWSSHALLTGTIRYKLAAVVVAVLVAWIMFTDVGNNPAGFFCDEAELGLETRKLIDGLRPSLFYHHFGYEHLGALPLYAGAPVVMAMGLSDASVRMSSVIWSVAALLVLVALVRALRWRNGEIAVVLFACTPVFIHMGRVNFGHAPSLFCLSSGLYAYVRARGSTSWRWAALAGLAFGASIYGHGAYYIATPIIVAGLVLGELMVNRLNWRAYRQAALSLLFFALSWLPVIYKALTDDQFLQRFREKDTTSAPFLSGEHLREMLDNYPKYFDLGYLFRTAEFGMPGGWNMRHSVPGAGTLTWIALPLIIAGVIAIFRIKDGTSRVIGIAGLTTLVLYPIPDLITTTSLNAPYTLTIFTTLICVPLLAGLGMHWISGWFQNRRAVVWSSWILPIGMLAIILVGAVRFNTGPYERYPLISTGYYGWQFGPRQAIAVFEEHADDYDRYVLDGDFNEAFVFLDFYLEDNPELRRKAIIGGMEKADGRRTELFAIRAEKYDAMMQSTDNLRKFARLIDVVRDPSGAIVMYLVEIGPTPQRESGDQPS